MEELVSASVPSGGSFGALLRACRHRAHLSQEQLAARAELSVRAVRNLEAGRVRSPRNDTMRLLADALQLSETERDSWFEAARGMHHREDRPIGPMAKGFDLIDLIEKAVRARVSQAGLDAATSDDGGLTSAEQRELAQLRRENRRLRDGWRS